MLNRIKVAFSSLSLTQKISLGIIFLSLLLLPVVTLASLRQARLRSRAAFPATPPVTPPIPPTPTPAPLMSPFQQAILLDGATAYINVGNSAEINPQLGFTAEAWIKPERLEFGAYIVSKNLPEIDNHASLFISSRKNLNDNNIRRYYSFGLANSGDSCRSYSVDSSVQQIPVEMAFAWQHVAAVIGLDGKMDIFVDGRRMTQNSVSISGVCSGTEPVIVGARNNSNTPEFFFPGQIDEVRISNISRYLSNFTPSPVIFAPDINTQLLYHLDNNAQDAGGGNRHGQIVGNAQFVPSTIPGPLIVPPSNPPSLPFPAACPSATSHQFSLYYGYVYIDMRLTPEGTQVWAVNPRGQIAGCQVSRSNGLLPFIRVQGEESSPSLFIPGMRLGEPVTFYINDRVAAVNPSPIIWNDLGNSPYRIDLFAFSTPPLLPDLTVNSLSVSPQFPRQYQNVEVKAEVANTGREDVKSLSTAALYIRPRGRIEPPQDTLKPEAWLKVGKIEIGRLRSGETQSVSFLLTPQTGGDHFLKVAADINDEIKEENETNNEKVQAVSIESVIPSSPIPY